MQTRLDIILETVDMILEMQGKQRRERRAKRAAAAARSKPNPRRAAKEIKDKSRRLSYTDPADFRVAGQFRLGDFQPDVSYIQPRERATAALELAGKNTISRAAAAKALQYLRSSMSPEGLEYFKQRYPNPEDFAQEVAHMKKLRSDHMSGRKEILSALKR